MGYTWSQETPRLVCKQTPWSQEEALPSIWRADLTPSFSYRMDDNDIHRDCLWGLKLWVITVQKSLGKWKSSIQIIILETALSPAFVTACKLWLAGLQASCYRGHHSNCHCTDEENYSEERHNRGYLAELIRMCESRSSSHTHMQELHSN